MKKIVLFLLTGYLLNIGIANSQQITPSTINQPVRFNKIVSYFRYRNTVQTPQTLHFIPYEFGKNEENQKVVNREAIAEGVTISPPEITIGVGQEKVVRFTIDVPESQDSREVAICPTEIQVNILGQQDERKQISRALLVTCLSAEGSRLTNDIKLRKLD